MDRAARTGTLARWVLLVSLVLLAACGSSRQVSSGTPGYTDPDDTVDTAPFERAGPSNSSGSSTIPEAVLEPDLAEPTLPPVPESTTTTTLGPLVDPDVAAVVDLCGFEENVAPFQQLPFADPAEVEQLIVTLAALMGRYVEVAPSVLEPDLFGLQGVFVDLREVLSTVGFDAASPAFLERVEAITAEARSGSPDSFAARLTRVVKAEKRLCI